MMELAAQAPGLPDDAGSYVEDARAAADRLIALVNNLLDISRLENGRFKIAPRPTDLHALTRAVLADLATLVRERDQRVTVVAGAETPAVMVDPDLVRQAVMNLVSNAIKYTPAGGAITVRLAAAGDAVLWAVDDNGIGIPAADQPRLFDKFFRADNVATIETEGTGLGLCLVRLIVAQFGGEVWCESVEGKGSTFSMTLPAVAAA
jgi:signal transduction histidine kinase